MATTNLAGWLFGSGTKAREMRETRRDWEQTQALWRASPFADGSYEPLLADVLDAANDQAQRVPAAPVLRAAAEAVYGLLEDEPIGDIEPRWEAIETVAEAAMEFREMMARRRRWCADHRQMFATFRRVAAAALAEFYDRLPDTCFEEWDAENSDVFEVPLLDLMDEPEMAVEGLFGAPYDEQVFRLDLFKRLRDQSGRNILVASGFRPDASAASVRNRFLYPRSQKDKTGAELADLYLNWSPLRSLVDLPVPFSIPDYVRFEHCHVVGGTGHGKTQLLQKMIYADLLKSQEDGRSVVVIDSQGDLINKLVRLDLFTPDAADSLADRLVLIDPSDVEYPAALNLFDAHLDRVKTYTPADRERIFNGVVELYELFFGAFLGAELTQKQGVIFRYLARLMLAVPDATIHTLIQIMEDGAQFKPYMEQLDGSARHFFETEFFHPSFAATKKQVVRRLWGVLSTPAFERMFTQPKNKLDLFTAMNEGKIILVNTAKDLLKRDGSALLGRFFIAMVMQAAQERSTVPERLRTPTFVYVDEAQEYFDDSVETILNQARKYNVGLTIAHQTLDQLSPRLRSGILTNTSIKCAGGVSAKDASTLADELRTTSRFIEGMKRRGKRTEFAAWVKHRTGQAIRLTVPLGFLERQPTLDQEDYDELLARNRERYCGTFADIPAFTPPVRTPLLEPPTAERKPTAQPATAARTTSPEHATGGADTSPPMAAPTPDAQVRKSEIAAPTVADRPARPMPATPAVAKAELPPDPGKGGKQHRYLQAMIKELAEQQGLKATIEATLTNRSGQVDVLLERDGVVAAIEISVSTPVEHERENLRKCLDEGYPRTVVVLAKSKKTQASYRAALTQPLSATERERVSFLTPEELPDYIAALAPPSAPTERTVKGYRVKGSVKATSPEEAKARQDAIAKLISRSLSQ